MKWPKNMNSRVFINRCGLTDCTQIFTHYLVCVWVCMCVWVGGGGGGGVGVYECESAFMQGCVSGTSWGTPCFAIYSALIVVVLNKHTQPLYVMAPSSLFFRSADERIEKLFLASIFSSRPSFFFFFIFLFFFFSSHPFFLASILRFPLCRRTKRVTSSRLGSSFGSWPHGRSPGEG